MPKDFIPRPDNDFDPWQINWLTYVNNNFTALGLSGGDLVPVQVAALDWGPKFASHKAAQIQAVTLRQAKDDSRANYEKEIRSLTRRIQAYPQLTDAQRVALGITVPGQPGPPPPPPGSRPVIAIDTRNRLQHILSWVDEITGKLAKPEGIRGAEIWIKIGDPAPVGPNDVLFLAFDTASPYLTVFDQADGGKRAHYLLRWVTDDGEHLSWSELASATIPA